MTADQLAAIKRKFAGRTDVRFVHFTDEGISGAALANRPGIRAMMVAAERGEIDLVVTEALNRLSRDQEGTAHIYKRLTYCGVGLETLSEGKISELHVGLSGTMNQLFLAELGRKTRRGLNGRVKRASPAAASATATGSPRRASWRSTTIRPGSSAESIRPMPRASRPAPWPIS